MEPTVEELQQSILHACQLMLDVCHGIQRWDQTRIMPWVALRDTLKASASTSASAVGGTASHAGTRVAGSMAPVILSLCPLTLRVVGESFRGRIDDRFLFIAN